MKIIAYNSEVARTCGNNGIIKAVLLNYIYNYHKLNTSKGAGYPAAIKLAEFVYQYTHGDRPLWCRSFIHRILKDLAKDGYVVIARRNGQPVYSVSPAIVRLLTAEDAKIVSFDLETACTLKIHVAIVSRFLLHVIDRSPNGEAYNLNVVQMSEVNRLSPAQIYRAIDILIKGKVIKRVKSPLKFKSRAMGLARYETPASRIRDNVKTPAKRPKSSASFSNEDKGMDVLINGFESLYRGSPIRNNGSPSSQ